jgi:hypothetical protein
MPPGGRKPPRRSHSFIDNSISKGLTLTQEESKMKEIQDDYSKFKKEMEIMFGKTSSTNQSMQQQLENIQRNIATLQ